MDIHNKTFTILLLCAFTVLVNLPFGYMRTKTKRYSLRWFFCIHIPIPLIFIARMMSHIEFKYIPILVLSAIIGQIMGGKLEW